MLEERIRSLFDYQRFVRYAALEGMIDEVLARYDENGAVFLSDDELAAAAGGAGTARQVPGYDRYKKL